MSVALLLATATAAAVGTAALHAAHGLRKQLTALRSELVASDRAGAATVPAARTTPAEEIRAAVADALAEERERELAEARAFWAAQEARDAADTPPMPGGPAGPATGIHPMEPGGDAPLWLPRQADSAGLEPLPGGGEMPEVAELLESIEAIDAHEQGAGSGRQAETEESPERAAARRRHPSHPANAHDSGSTPAAPAAADQDRTMHRLEKLAASATPLTDVRPGPRGTLDVYVFADGTTICMTPGHRETAERLAGALREGKVPVLLGGSAISGAYALTFAYGLEAAEGGTDRDESVYVLADRVIASL